MLRLHSWSLTQFWNQVSQPAHTRQSHADQPEQQTEIGNNTQTVELIQRNQLQPIETIHRTEQVHFLERRWFW